MANLYERDFQNQRPLPGARIGIREELSDLILNVDAKDTPITSMAKRGSKPGNTTFRWQVDRNPEPSVELGIVDGKDVDPNNLTGANAGLGGGEFKQYTVGFRTEVENNIHMFRRAVHVSNLTQDVLNIAGVKDELSRQLSKATIDLKRSMELTFTSDILPVLDNGTLPYRTRCLTAWIKPELASATVNTQLKYGVQASNSSAGNYRQEIRSINENFLTPSTSIVGTDLTVDNLSENDVQDVMTSVYEQTGQFRSHEAVVGTSLKRQFTNLVYTQRAPASGLNPTINSNRDANSDTIKASVDVFEGDFGRLSLIPSQFLHAGVNPYTVKFHTNAEITANGSALGALGITSGQNWVVYDGDVTNTANIVLKNVTWSNGVPTVDTTSAVAAYTTEADAKKHVNLHAQNAKTKGFIIPWEYLEIRYGGNIAQVRELTENGGGPRRMMEAMAALVVQSPLCFGMFDYKANDA
jgi:hypothetical protein